jgi:hypothetical protein
MTKHIKTIHPGAQHWEISGKHVILSRIDDPSTHAGYEVLAFATDASGEMLPGIEVWGWRYRDCFPDWWLVVSEVERAITHGAGSHIEGW